MKVPIIVIMLLFVAVTFGSAVAKRLDLNYSVKKAVAEAPKRENLLNVPYYMMGQKNPKVKRKLGTHKASQQARAFGNSDKVACQSAFINALLSLQKQAMAEGADAVINIRSVTRGKKLESATEFLCVVGTIMAQVALKGELVTTK